MLDLSQGWHLAQTLWGRAGVVSKLQNTCLRSEDSSKDSEGRYGVLTEAWVGEAEGGSSNLALEGRE